MAGLSVRPCATPSHCGILTQLFARSCKASGRPPQLDQSTTGGPGRRAAHNFVHALRRCDPADRACACLAGAMVGHGNLALSAGAQLRAPITRQQHPPAAYSLSIPRGSRPLLGGAAACWRQRQWRQSGRLSPLCSSSSAAPGSAAAEPPQQQQQQQQQGRGPLGAWQAWWQLEADVPAAGSATPATTAPQDMGLIMRKVGQLLAPDKALLAAAIVFMLTAAAAELAIPHYVTAAVFAAAKVGDWGSRSVGVGLCQEVGGRIPH